MNTQEITAVLKILKLSYPQFYKNMTKQEASETVELWSTMFRDDDARIVTEAVKSLIVTLKFPPTIADVKEKIRAIEKPCVMTGLEAWNLVKGAISHYSAVEKFNNLPQVLQKLVGSPNQLREWAGMDLSLIHMYEPTRR